MQSTEIQVTGSAITAGATQAVLVAVNVPKNCSGPACVLITASGANEAFASVKITGIVQRATGAPVWVGTQDTTYGVTPLPDAPEVIVGDGGTADPSLLTVEVTGLSNFPLTWRAVARFYLTQS